MDLEKKIVELHDRGVKIWEDRGKIHYKIKAGLIDKSELDFLKENKDAVIKQLTKELHNTGVNCKNNEFPLTEIQSAYLVGRGDNYKYGSVSSHVYFEVSFPELDNRRVQEIWEYLINRHDSLRTIITEDNNQKVLNERLAYKISINEGKTNQELSDNINKIRNELKNKYYSVDRWPLFDIAISQLKDKSLMHLSFDFLILDWTSVWLLLKEFEVLYFSESVKLNEIKYSFKEYYYESIQNKKSSQYLVDKKYWLEQINDFPEHPKLPMELNSLEDFFERENVRIKEKDWLLIKENARQKGFTQTSLALTAFAIAIEKWCENSEFIINLTTMNRECSNSEVEFIVGDFTSTNLLKTKIDRNESVSENIKKTQKQLVKNLEHSSFSGIEVLRQLRRVNKGDNNIFPIVFTSSLGVVTSKFDYLKVESEGISQSPQVFLDCQVMEINGELNINFDSRKGVFPNYLIKSIIRRYQRVIEQLVDSRNWDTKILNIDEKENNLNIETLIGESTAMPERLEKALIKQIKKNPNKIAVIKGSKETTFRELGYLAGSITKILRKNNIRSKDRIGVMMKQSDFAIASLIGILSLDCTFIPIDLGLPSNRIQKIIDSSEIKALLIDEELDNTLNRCKVLLCNETDEEEICVNEINDVSSSAYIIFTSGSTGTPKGVEITHAAASNTLKSVINLFEITDKSVILGLSKLSFDLSIFDIFGILSMGGTVVYLEDDSRLSPEHWVELIKKHNINTWNTVPALMSILIKYLSNNKEKKSLELKTVLLSGDWIPITMPKEIKKIFNDAKVVSLGGATEASIWSIYHEYNNEEYSKSIPYGKSLPNQKVCVLDKYFKERPALVPGEIFISGEGLAKGYVNDINKTEKSFIKNPYKGDRLYRTGDYGRYLSNGEIEFLGRKDEQIKLNGYRIELGDIQLGLLENENIESAEVIYDYMKKELVAFVIPKINYTRDNMNKSVEFDIEEYVVNVEKECSKKKNELKEVLEKRDILSEKAILNALIELGLVDIENEKHDKLYHYGYDWIIKYWTNHLENKNYLYNDSGILTLSDKGRQLLNTNIDLNTLRKEWENNIGNVEFIDYIIMSSKKIISHIKNETDPLKVLYPEGEVDTVESIYSGDVFTDYYNSVISKLISLIAKKKDDGNIRILELGGGTAITSQKVLKDLNYERIGYKYYFTDRAKSFIMNAKQKLMKFDNVEYLNIDINKKIVDQGILPNDFDIVVAVGVLENAKNIEDTISNIRNILNFKGWLIFSEPVVEEAWILMSQIFMMDKPEDDIRGESSYLTKKEWKDILNGFESKYNTLILPDEKSIYSINNINIFAKQFNNNRSIISEDDIQKNLKLYVPEYMIPKKYCLLDEIPLNINGKIDKKKLLEYSDMLSNRHNNNKNKQNTLTKSNDNKLTEDICEITKKLFTLNHISSSGNLYDYGADSLVLAQLAGEVKKYLEEKRILYDLTFDMILRQLINNPNINELSSFIDEKNRIIANRNYKDSYKTGNIGKLNIYKKGKDILRVFFHAGFGTMDSMRYIIRDLTLQNNSGVAGITINDNKRYCELPSDKLATTLGKEYAELIIKTGYKKVQLIGYCSGGLLAIEAAQYLVEAGIIIEDISLIDSFPSPLTKIDQIVSEFIFLPNFLISIEDVYPEISNDKLRDAILEMYNACGEDSTVELLSYLTENREENCILRNILNQVFSQNIDKRFEKYAEVIEKKRHEKIDKEFLMSTYRTQISSWNGANFQPFPYIGDVRFLMAEEKVGFILSSKNDDVNFWRGCCLGNFKTIEIPGNHVTCVEDEENAKYVIKILNEPINDKIS